VQPSATQLRQDGETRAALSKVRHELYEAETNAQRYRLAAQKAVQSLSHRTPDALDTSVGQGAVHMTQWLQEQTEARDASAAQLRMIVQVRSPAMMPILAVTPTLWSMRGVQRASSSRACESALYTNRGCSAASATLQ
jgi:hypothetical protein